MSSIPPVKPSETEGLSNDDRSRMRAQEAMQAQANAAQMAQFALQQQANKEAADISSKSAIEKAKHDALMNIANNIK